MPVLKEKNESAEDEEDEEEEDDDEEDEEDEDECSGSGGSERETETKRFTRKREKEDRLDCESIISTYSNIYNHPATIKSDEDDDEESRIRISKKTGLPLGVLKDKEKSKRELERIEHNIVRVLPELPLKRDRNESKDEKKERKQAIKAHRRERRVEKKINKMAFKDEKKTQVKEISNSMTNKSLVKLPL